MSGVPRSTVRVFAGRYLIALAVAIVFTATGVAAVNREIDDRVGAIKRVPVAVATPPPEGANYLLIGSDTREFVNNETDANAFGDPTQESGKNSDTLMVAHIEPGAKSALVVSFPRDLVVEVPDQPGKMAKINSFFGDGGPDAVVSMLNWNFDIPIHHYVEVDFESFRQVVNAIGSVPIFFEYPTRDEYTGLLVDEGPVCKALDGDQALQYVRSRYTEQEIDGVWQYVGQDKPDIYRIARQQEFIRKLMGLAIAQSLDNPIAALDIADHSLQYMTLDATAGRDQVNELISAFKTVDVNDPNSVRFETVATTENPSKAYGSSQVLTGDGQAMIDTLRTFGNNQPPPTTVVPSQVKVRVLEAWGLDRAAGVSEQLTEQGFKPAGSKNLEIKTILSEIRYPPAEAAAAKLLGTYVQDASLRPDPSLDDHLLLVLGNSFEKLTVPTTTTTVAGSPAAPTSTALPPAPPTTAAIDPRAAACS